VTRRRWLVRGCGFSWLRAQPAQPRLAPACCFRLTPQPTWPARECRFARRAASHIGGAQWSRGQAGRCNC
jgi:hypothetical protein